MDRLGLLLVKRIYPNHSFKRNLNNIFLLHYGNYFKSFKSLNTIYFEKKTLVSKSHEAKKKIYYKFLCKCRLGFNTFPEFLFHIKAFHQINNLDIKKILEKKNGFKSELKFYWSLKCQCGHKFSSSLCNADLKVNEGNIEITKIYDLRCLKCEQIAKFDEELLLNEFLEERLKQQLIYNYYKESFTGYNDESHSTKKLEGHIRRLCEKCKQSRTGFCGYYNSGRL